MINDIRTVMWKEWKGLLRQRGSRMRALLTLLVPFFVFVVYVPWDAGDHWLHGLPPFFAAVAIPLTLVLLTVPDSFAGERERRTLSTLLASRLPDRAILFGKAGFSVALCWGAAMLTLIGGLVTSNIGNWAGHLSFYSSRVALGAPTLSLLTTGLAVGAGILISVRSATVQEAQQTLTATLFLPPMILGPLVLVVRRNWPDWRLTAVLGQVDPQTVFLCVLGVLLLIDLALFALAMARFQRSRLILNS